MKFIYRTILLVALALIPVPAALAVNPSELDVPEETWEIHYDSYQSLYNDDPSYRDLTRTVTIKKDATYMYIQGIFEEYPDAWVSARYFPNRVTIRKNQELLLVDENSQYLKTGRYSLFNRADNDREYTIGVSLKSSQFEIWHYGDDGENNNILIPSSEDIAVWIGSESEKSRCMSWTYHYDGTLTGDDLGPKPIYIYPTFHKISSSGIMDTIIEQQQPEDTRVFDLSGRQVNPDRLTPGIYIRAGRKFIVR